MRMTYANCFVGDPGDVLVTDEVTVAAAAPARTRSIVADERYDTGTAQDLNERLARLAYAWAAFDDGDPTSVHGVSAADLAGQELLLTLLLPAARGVLDMDAALAEALPSRFETVVADGGGETFQRIEGVTCDAAEAAVRARMGEGVTLRRAASGDARNRALIEKYARTRNPDFLPSEPTARRALARAACVVANLAAAARPGVRRPAVAVYQYNPTAAFARSHAARRTGDLGLVRYRFGREDLCAMLRAGDRGLAPSGGRPGRAAEGVAARLDDAVARHASELAERFTVAGVPLWPVLWPSLRRLVASYASWIDARAPALRRDLLRFRARAVLVPFDGPPDARLLVRIAQSEGIPTVVINDGWKGDDHSVEGMTTDRALAWSSQIAERYFSRRPQPEPAVITGDPRADAAGWPRPVARATGAMRRVVVGTFTFSPVDLNCRRSDPERFLGDVLEGIRRSRAARGAEIVVKLHPADREGTYADLLSRFGELALRVVAEGDVVDLFRDADAYVTTYSTSLLEAAAAGVPFAYYRVNDQRLHPPFSDDPIMDGRTACTPDELAALLDRPGFADVGDEAAARAWVERHLGPRDGLSTQRVTSALEALVEERG